VFERFLDHITNKKFFHSKARIVVALSGGMDSMVLVRLMQKAEILFSVAHFDHLTRNGASTQDANFVSDFCAKQNLSFHLGTMNSKHVENNFQAEARRQRYAFFKSLEPDCLVTAHHRDDQIESLTMRFFEGKPLFGIPERNGTIVRPLLPFTKKEIQEYALKNEIDYREDQSNASDDYMRNLVRNKVLPLVEERLPNLGGRILQQGETYKSAQNDLYRMAENILAPEMYDNKIRILKSAFNVKDNLLLRILYNYLSPLGFSESQAEDIANSLDQSGRRFMAGNHTVLLERTCLIISAETEAVHNNNALIVNLSSLPVIHEIGHWVFRFEKASGLPESIPSDKFYCPLEDAGASLVLRFWKEGDRFQPYGLEGRSQSLKKFFTNKKLNSIDKHNTPLLCHQNGNIMWVCGLRSDHRYHVRQNTEHLLEVSITRKNN